MAKLKMMCPFLGTTCQECAFYRGRHYYLCFAPKYRGYIAGSEETTLTLPLGKTNDQDYPWAKFNGDFKLPSKIPTGSYDPFTRPQNDIE
jgi:hypothetical protein